MTIKQVMIFISVISLLVGCGEKSENKFCTVHRDVHQQHQNNVTTVDVSYLETGRLLATVEVPITQISETELNQHDKVLRVDAEQECYFVSLNIGEQKGVFEAKYHVECGMGNRLKKVTISLLENFSQIDEIEAFIDTPASKKHFILSRQCDGPIFNI
ncbi:MAG: hypothetical protein KUG78_07680 [Kangiellaceae bacterium]|nr:hypothetical protein [Kangiellaceae bacterium]